MGFEHSSDIVFSAASAIIMTNNGRVIRVPLSLWAQEGVIAPPQGLYEMIGNISCSYVHSFLSQSHRNYHNRYA